MEFFSLKQSNVNGKGKQSHLNKFNFKNSSIKKHLKKKKTENEQTKNPRNLFSHSFGDDKSQYKVSAEPH